MITKRLQNTKEHYRTLQTITERLQNTKIKSKHPEAFGGGGGEDINATIPKQAETKRNRKRLGVRGGGRTPYGGNKQKTVNKLCQELGGCLGLSGGC